MQKSFSPACPGWFLERPGVPSLSYKTPRPGHFPAFIFRQCKKGFRKTMAYTKIIAHRGSRGTKPENTLVSFQEAMAVHSDGIELDVHLSKDGEVVVIHDETVDWTTNGNGYVKDLTLKQLKDLDAGSWFDKKYSDCKIPTLQEVLAFLEECRFAGVLNIELKTDVFQYPEIEGKVLGLTEPYLSNFTIIYSSFHYGTLKKIKALQKEAEIALLFSETGKNVIELGQGVPVGGWHPKFSILRSLPPFETSRIPLRVWTVNRKVEMQVCLRRNIDSMITDFPERALQLRKVIQGG
ncbi:Hypothetical protein Tpal_893 [Trichococcus palustris]|uniref:GP-PDE domain-containing protein n=2 Tax=Trichococcus palustris TaxID=140314 RepID=A0A143YEC3_9LACT|nr:Hypothetical protein Tpal_893 [Trichococcus palustris]SFK78998.1 glycerophosphoryl diester phosphodiesterase [Trichococcus palustris]